MICNQKSTFKIQMLFLIQIINLIYENASLQDALGNEIKIVNETTCILQ
jgi:hypothetical protein